MKKLVLVGAVVALVAVGAGVNAQARSERQLKDGRTAVWTGERLYIVGQPGYGTLK